MSQLTVLGGGSYGTALAIAIAPRFDHVLQWVNEPDLAARMQSARENDLFLPGVALPSNLVATNCMEQAIAGSDILLGVMPSSHARAVYEQARAFVTGRQIIVSATKGIENGTLLRISEVAAQVLGHLPIAVLSGPSFAKELAKGDPTAVVVASRSPQIASTVQQAFSTSRFRLYNSIDPVGVEIGGAVKNVIAIAAGVCDGLGLGSNTRAALITRGLAEMTRLAEALGGQARTMAGLAGLGDLVLTCTGSLSRNRSVGLELAKGRTLADIVSSTRTIAEGVETTKAAVGLAKKVGVEMPIAEQMNALLYQGRTAADAVKRLMERDVKGE